MGGIDGAGWFGKEKAGGEAPDNPMLLGDPYLRFEGAAEPDPKRVTRMPSRWRMWLSALGLGWLCGREMAGRK